MAAIADVEMESSEITAEIQLFPHSEVPLHRQDQLRPFLFTPVEKTAKHGVTIHIGRKIDRSKDTNRGTTREDRAAHNVSLDASHLSGIEGTDVSEAITFRSKVVSRHHAEMWVGKDGVLYFRDVGSSSGTFLNRLRLSPSGKDSRPYPLKNGDIIQLGVDYQGRQEGMIVSLEIYKAVMIKVFINSKRGVAPQASRAKMSRALKSLIYAMNPNSTKEDEMNGTDCCICLNSMAPFQALFLGPCSHCFHYKCVTPLLGAGFMFQCPLCRQVANLEASVAEPDGLEKETTDTEDEDDESEYVGKGKTLARGSRNETLHIAIPQPRLDESSGLAGSVNSLLSPVDGIMSPSTPRDYSMAQTLQRAPPPVPNATNQLMDSLCSIINSATSNNTENLTASMQQYNVQLKQILEQAIGDNQLQKELLERLALNLNGSSR